MGYGGMSQGGIMVHGGMGGACCPHPVAPVAPYGFRDVDAEVGVGIIAIAILILIALGVIF